MNFLSMTRKAPFKAGSSVLIAALVLSTAITNAQTGRSPQPARSSRKSMAAKNPNVLMPTRSPIVSMRFLFLTGAAADPKGKEGLANLTAALIANGGSRTTPYEKIVEAMYPMASSFSSQTDKEMTVFVGATHVDNLDLYYSLVRQMLLDPGFREDDFNRIKTQAINYLDKSLRNGNDEELGKEQLYSMIYQGHPYGHHNVGTISSLQKLTLADVRDFYKKNYTRANLVLGLAGGYSPSFEQRVQRDFATLPAGSAGRPNIPTTSIPAGTQIDLITRETRSTAISLGFPIPVTREHEDWAALSVAASYLGQHRSSNSYLYQQLREARGLNYGDYAYIEYFPRGMFQFEPDPNLGRQEQIFQIWIRPVEPENGHFALRAALYELGKLVKNGMSQQDFESTREFLSKYANILTATQDAQLGYALDSRYYGIEDYSSYFRQRLAKLTLKDVNAAIRKYLASEQMRIAIVTKDAQGLRDAILNNKTSPITYNSPKPKEILDEDKIIQDYRIDLKPENVRIVPVNQVFQ